MYYDDRMEKQKVYIETSIVSYLNSRPSKNPITFGRQQLTHEWWKNRSASFDVVVSELVFQEASAGDGEAAQKRINFLDPIPSLAISENAIILSEKLIFGGPLPKEYSEDALHIALCAVNGIDFLLTWNCKHLANAMHRQEIERLVEMNGYACPVICTPAELMEE